MKNLQMFCLTLNEKHLNKIQLLNYTPVGLGETDLAVNGFQTSPVKQFIKKIHFMESTLFIIGFGKLFK